jgi:hypothetical protein
VIAVLSRGRPITVAFVRLAESMSQAAYDPVAKKRLRYSSWKRQRGRPRK